MCVRTYDCTIGRGLVFIWKCIMDRNRAFRNCENEENSLSEPLGRKKEKYKQGGANIKQKTFNKRCELILLFIPLY